MTVLVICRPAEGFAERASALLADEGNVLRQLWSEGLLLQAWRPDGPGAVLLFDAAVGDVQAALERLPLVREQLITTEAIPLTPLPLGE